MLIWYLYQIQDFYMGIEYIKLVLMNKWIKNNKNYNCE